MVNTPTTLGSIGLTTGLDPSMTLGCGGYGGNITSDNISPRHLLNIKRLAYETTPGRDAPPGNATGRRGRGRCQRRRLRRKRPPASARPPLARRIDEFLASRGYAAPASTDRPPAASCASSKAGVFAERRPNSGACRRKGCATSFARKTSGRQCGRDGKILVGDRTIVTPAARDLAEQHKLFVQAGWPRS